MKTIVLNRLSVLYFLLLSQYCFSQAGALDSSFGVNGKVSTDFAETSGFVYGTSAGLQSDGKIVMAGYLYHNSFSVDFMVSRFLTNGHPDSTFGLNGKVNTLFGFGITRAFATKVAVQPDGKILAGGYYSTVTPPFASLTAVALGQVQVVYIALARYLSNGTIDSTFGVSGKVVTVLYNEFIPFGGTNAMSLQSDGSILVGGNINGFYLVKYKPNGIIDSTFAVNGKLLRTGDSLNVRDIKILSDGKILLAQSGAPSYSSQDFSVAKLNTNGSYDSSFGNNGQTIIDFYGGSDTIYSIALTPNGGIIAAGTATNPLTNKGEIAVAKFTANGSPDLSFGTNGKVTLLPFGTAASVRKVLLQSDGKIILSGMANDTLVQVVRLNANGSLDNSFGNNGSNRLSFGTNTVVYDAVLQQDEKLITAGQPNFSLARFKKDELVTVALKKSISVLEGNTGTTSPAQFKVILNKLSPVDVFVNYTTKNLNALAGSDYTATAGTLRIKAGKPAGNIIVSIIGDNTREANERFALVLSNPVNAVLGTLDSAVCVIKNDDPSFAFTNSTTQEDISVDNMSVKIYPNPVKDVLNIQGLSTLDKTQISILDINGHVLAAKSINTSSFVWNIKSLAPGTYYLHIENRMKQTALKFVKQ
ncbi:T9SS type A sorting domain-containing protein [Panacibacter ginsenosidivorans]|uniref:T9SS type A sorting domain-containing protein n=1 Tax=Panacibacter ginsenosidivorans TaxID=1813871 RepID=A0A5B8VDY3_9BACT|nr:T9SS type A sorting domain-containing protein [Panacibacter ginsenosidivorans]QEC69532.1 T9SS type A sorting domain-containing protein [Panacibacter ginsenosidivorans]